MLQAAFPNLAPIYGIVASLMFSVAYSFTNIFMSALSGQWNKKRMLIAGVTLMSLTSIVSGSTSSLLVFAFMRFCYGMFASAINAPIYQLIATNFPPKYRSTANAIETSGYWIGNALASLMVLIIKFFGWRAMYYFMGSIGITLGAIVLAFVKNPTTPSLKEIEQDQ